MQEWECILQGNIKNRDLIFKQLIIMDISKNTRDFLLIGGGLILFGAIVLLVGINMQKENRYIKQVCTAQTEGIVSGFHENKYTRDGEKFTDYYPVFKYEVNNRTYVQQSPFYNTDRKRFNQNQQITVRFNPDNPDEYYVPSDWAANAYGIYAICGACLFLLLGVTCTAVGIIKIFRS
jgi:hypothetical protein